MQGEGRVNRGCLDSQGREIGANDLFPVHFFGADPEPRLSHGDKRGRVEKRASALIGFRWVAVAADDADGIPSCPVRGWNLGFARRPVFLGTFGT